MLSDLLKHAAGSGEHSAPPPAGARKMPVAVTVKAEPLDTKHAAADLLKAIKADDVNGMEDALRVFFAACDEDDDDGDDEKKADDAEADEQEDEGGE